MPEAFSPLARINGETLSADEIAFMKQLHLLKMEADKLIKNNQLYASQCVDKLYNDLCFAFSEFHSNKGEADTYETFKTNSLTAIQEADKRLDQHHQVKKILLNLTLAVFTLGIGYLAAISINKITTGRFTLFNRHGLKNQLDDLEEDITSDHLDC